MATTIKISDLQIANTATPDTILLAVNTNLNRSIAITISALSAYMSNSVSILQSSAAFDKANNAFINAGSAYGQSNIAFSIASYASITANSNIYDCNGAFTQANLAFIKANTALTAAQGAFSNSNTNIINTKSAYNQANISMVVAQSAFGAANSAGSVSITSAFNIANIALSTAQSAFTQANTANFKINSPAGSVLSGTLLYFQTTANNIIANSGITVSSNNTLLNFKTIGFLSEYDNANTGTSKTINLVNGQRQKILANANSTLTINTTSAPPSTYTLRIIQDSVGSRYITFSGIDSNRWINSIGAPDINISPNGETLMSIYFDGVQMIQNLGKVGTI